MVNFTINLHHDGCFVTNPLHYLEGGHRVVEDIDFEGVIYSEFCHIIRKLVIIAPVSYFYVKTGVQLNIGLKQLKTDEDLKEFVKAGSENDFKMDIYTEHNGYNVMEMIRNDNLHMKMDPELGPSTPADAKKKRGRPKKATTEPSLKPLTKADAKKSKGKKTVDVEASTTVSAKKSKGKEPVYVEASTTADAKKTRDGPKKTTTEPSYGRIYYKNRGRSERIANQNKPFKFDKYGTDKAFSVD
ncbi:hypothetical protein Tco_0217816 [Tanacetum coccineum]